MSDKQLSLDEVGEQNEGSLKQVRIGPRILKFPADWDVRNLDPNNGVTNRITDGAHHSPDQSDNGEYYYGTVSNMSSYGIDYHSCDLIDKEEYDKMVAGDCKPKKGEVLFSKDGTVGLTSVFDGQEDIVLLSSIAMIDPDKDYLNSKYLSQYLSSWLTDFQIQSLKSGTAIRRVVLVDLEKLSIPLPLLPEQRKIATVLYMVDRAIEKTEEIIEQSKRVSSGIKQNILTTGLEDSSTRNVRIVSQEVEVRSQWDMVPLPRMAEKGNDCFTDGDWVESEDMVEKGEYQLIQLGNVGEGRFKGECNRYVDQDFFENENCTLVEKGDLLISRMADPILRTVIVPEFEKKSITAVDIVVAKVDETEWDKRYLTHLLNTKTWQNIAEALASGSTRKRISRENMSRILIPKPEIDAQRDIADIIESVENRISVERRCQQQLRQLKRGLMQDLLSGTVRTTDTNIEVPDEIAQYG